MAQFLQLHTVVVNRLGVEQRVGLRVGNCVLASRRPVAHVRWHHRGFLVRHGLKVHVRFFLHHDGTYLRVSGRVSFHTVVLGLFELDSALGVGVGGANDHSRAVGVVVEPAPTSTELIIF